MIIIHTCNKPYVFPNYYIIKVILYVYHTRTHTHKSKFTQIREGPQDFEIRGLEYK